MEQKKRASSAKVGAGVGAAAFGAHMAGSKAALSKAGGYKQSARQNLGKAKKLRKQASAHDKQANSWLAKADQAVPKSPKGEGSLPKLRPGASQAQIDSMALRLKQSEHAEQQAWAHHKASKDSLKKVPRLLKAGQKSNKAASKILQYSPLLGTKARIGAAAGTGVAGGVLWHRHKAKATRRDAAPHEYFHNAVETHTAGGM